VFDDFERTEMFPIMENTIFNKFNQTMSPSLNSMGLSLES